MNHPSSSRTLALATAALLAGPCLAVAQSGTDAGHSHHSHHAQHAHDGAAKQDAKPATSLPMTDGEVRKVDKATGRMTVRHGRIENLNMNGMTMIFAVADKSWLDQFKEGDKVRLAVDRVNGAFTIVAIEAAPAAAPAAP